MGPFNVGIVLPDGTLETVGTVPGLAAKPIIDITLAVPDSADEDAYAPALEAAGYVLRIPPGMRDKFLLRYNEIPANKKLLSQKGPKKDLTAEHRPSHKNRRRR